MIPSGQSCQAETTSSHYSSFFGPSHSFIILLFLPPAPLTLTFVSYIFIDALPDAASPFASHSSTLVRLLNILPYQSSPVALWFLHYSSSSVSSTPRGFTKQTPSSKWNLNLSSELRTSLPREIFHQERQLYTLADADTQAYMESPSNVHVNTHACMYVRSQAA